MVHDNDGKSFAAAIEARTGKQLWRVERDLPSKSMQSGWSTPFVWRHDARTELIVIGKSHAVSYAPETGKELWRIGGLTGQSTPTPVAADGLLYLATGSQGESNRPVFAVRPGASGDITLAKGEESNQFVAWFHPRASAYTSSPLVYRGRMYVVNDNGILTVSDSKTGKEIYKARAGGIRQHLLGVAVGRGRQGLSPQRRRPHVRDRSRRQVRGAGEEQHGRNELRLARARTEHVVPANADEAVSNREVVRSRCRAGRL